MPRARRNDFPGAVFHVTNRAVEERSLYERRRDAHAFLALLEREVRARLLVVHAYALMPSRYHLLVGSPAGRLSEALRRIQDVHARTLNRRLGRSGPVFRGRYCAKLLSSDIHRAAVFAYVHDSPVRAGLVDDPTEHRLSSAHEHGRGSAAPWLDTTLGEPWQNGAAAYMPAWDLVDRWLRHVDAAPPDLDVLAAAAPEEVHAWLVAEALVEGRMRAHVLVRGDTIQRLVAAARTPEGLRGRPRRKRTTSWDLLEAGLLRTAAGLTLAEVAERLGTSVSTVHARVRAHRRGLTGPAYAALAGAVLHCALGEEYGRLLSRLV